MQTHAHAHVRTHTLIHTSKSIGAGLAHNLFSSCLCVVLAKSRTVRPDLCLQRLWYDPISVVYIFLHLPVHDIDIKNYISDVQESSSTTPLLFVLSSGTDPTAALLTFANAMKFGSKISVISMGLGQVCVVCKSRRGCLPVCVGGGGGSFADN